MPEAKNLIKENIPRATENASQDVERVQNVETVLNSVETLQANSDEATKGSTEKNNGAVAVSSSSISPVVPEVKNELRQAVERVMEADLKDLYLTMTPTERIAFKKKGEETAKEITSLMEKTKVNLNKILRLLFSWLKIIPGVNKLYLEQEAKLKADQLLKLPK